MSTAESVADDLDRRFLLLTRATDGPLFPYGQGIQLTLPGPRGTLTASLHSRYTEEGFNAPIGRELLVEVEGQAESADQVLTAFSVAASTVAATLSVANNCAINGLTPKFILETTPGIERREHVEFLIPLQTGPPPFTRSVRVEASDAFARALGGSPEFELLWPAVDHYAAALQSYRPGSLVMALEHLAIAAQRLEKALVAQRCRQQQLSEAQLAEALHAEFDLDGQPKVAALGAILRKRVIFQGDGELEEKVMNASHGLEHGSASMIQIQLEAIGVVDPAFRILRAGLIDAMDLAPVDRDGLLGTGRNDPLDFNVNRAVTGSWTSPQPAATVRDLAAADQEYPHLLWRPRMADVELQPDGPPRVNWLDDLTTNCAPGVNFTATGMFFTGHPAVLETMQPTVGSAWSNEDLPRDSGDTA